MPNDPPIVPKSKPDKKEKVKPKESPFIIEDPGAAGAAIFDSIVTKLNEGGYKMVLTKAHMRIETHALVKDDSIFKDDELHESTLVFECDLEREE